MVTISKRMRLWRGVPKTESDLDKFRSQAREALNKPFHFEAKPLARSWEEESSDPLVGPFKPFSKVGVTTVAPTFKTVENKREIARIDPRRLVLPLGIGVLALAAILLWQVFGTLSSYNGIISPTPHSVQVKSSPVPAVTVEPANSNVVPTGTQLQPGGPYTGTGGPEPTATPTNSSSNVAPTGGTTTNLTPVPTPSTASTPAPVAAPTCPSGMVCSGTAIDGSSCSISNPCRVVYPTTPLVQTYQLIKSGSTVTGQPCTLANPCILTH